MKIFSLIKATFTQDMNLFAYNTGKNASKSKKVLLPIILYLLVVFSMTSLIYSMGEILKPLDLMKTLLTIVFMGSVIITITEGIYKSQGILFNAKDNDLLFSLPITKSEIIFIRMIKLYVFEYLFNSMIILPGIIVYTIFEHPGIGFYIISFIASIFIPILPLVIASIIGYLIKSISSKFKNHKLIETIFTLLVFSVVVLLSMNTNNINNAIQKYAGNINDIVIKTYYPIKLYISLLDKFNILDLILLISINIIPLIIFILVAQKYYLNIITNDYNHKTSSSNKKARIKVRKPIISLANKELKRFISTPVYIFNSSFGLMLLLVVTFILGFKGKSAFLDIIGDLSISGLISLNVLYYGIVIFCLYMTSISSSSISLEGKTINITKSLPVSFKTIFDSKILACLIIEMPFVIISALGYLIFLKANIIFIIELLISALLIISLTAIIGLIMNLKYPKLNATNDTEVVKQSMSATVSVFIGMGSVLLNIVELIFLSSYISVMYIMLINIIILLILIVVLYNRLITKGQKEYLELNI